MKKALPVPVEQEGPEEQGYRDPGQIKQSGGNVQWGIALTQEKLIEGHMAALVKNTEYIFFSLVHAFNMHRVVMVVGKGLHVIKYNPVHDKYRKPENKPAGGRGQKIKQEKKAHQKYLFGLKADQEVGKCQIDGSQGGNQQHVSATVNFHSTYLGVDFHGQ